MNNYFKIALIRILIVFVGLFAVSNDMVFSAQATQQQLAFNARVPQVEMLAFDTPGAAAGAATNSVAQPSPNPIVTVEPLVVAAPVQQVSASGPVAPEVVSSAMPMPVMTDLNSRIKELYSAMQGAQNKMYDAATYAKFGSALVSVFNEAVETQSYMIQLLNAASGTPLLNAEQQNYVRQTMIPNLDQIDETTKPLAPQAGDKKPSRTQIYAAAHPNAAGHVATTPGGKKKRKKHKQGQEAAAQAGNPVNPTRQQHAAHQGVSATAGVAMAKPVSAQANKTNYQHKQHHQQHHPAAAGNAVRPVTVPSSDGAVSPIAPVANGVAANPVSTSSAPTGSPAAPAEPVVPVAAVPVVGAATDGDLIV